MWKRKSEAPHISSLQKLTIATRQSPIREAMTKKQITTEPKLPLQQSIRRKPLQKRHRLLLRGLGNHFGVIRRFSFLPHHQRFIGNQFFDSLRQFNPAIAFTQRGQAPVVVDRPTRATVLIVVCPEFRLSIFEVTKWTENYPSSKQTQQMWKRKVLPMS